MRGQLVSQESLVTPDNALTSWLQRETLRTYDITRGGGGGGGGKKGGISAHLQDASDDNTMPGRVHIAACSPHAWHRNQVLRYCLPIPIQPSPVRMPPPQLTGRLLSWSAEPGLALVQLCKALLGMPSRHCRTDRDNMRSHPFLAYESCNENLPARSNGRHTLLAMRVQHHDISVANKSTHTWAGSRNLGVGTPPGKNEELQSM